MVKNDRGFRFFQFVSPSKAELCFILNFVWSWVQTILLPGNWNVAETGRRSVFFAVIFGLPYPDNIMLNLFVYKVGFFMERNPNSVFEKNF